MKKTLIALTVAMTIGMAKSASVDWSVPGTSATDGTVVYLLSSVDTAYADAAALAAAAIDSATIVSQGRGKYSTPTKTSYGDAVTAAGSYYFAVVNSEGTGFNYISADLGSYVYDPGNQETSPGVFNTTSVATISAGTSSSFGPVPEPTSGLLLLLGVAGLALKRKRA